MSKVMHLNTIQGQSILSIKNDAGELALSTLGNFFSEVFDRIIASGDGWPADAVYKTKVRYKTWPTGWDKDAAISFFTVREELDAHLSALREWAHCEDNEVDVVVWEWDLGPSVVDHHHFM